jgi:hypothetical protein
MTVKTFWMDPTTRTAFARYVLISNKGWERVITRKHAAQIAFDPELPVGWRVERRIVENVVEACPWCAARPLEFEMDCDGWASTGTCGSPQCNQLKRCEGCGQDGTQNMGCWRGSLCNHCYEVATEKGLATIPGEYGLFRHADYAPYYA